MARGAAGSRPQHALDKGGLALTVGSAVVLVARRQFGFERGVLLPQLDAGPQRVAKGEVL